MCLLSHHLLPPSQKTPVCQGDPYSFKVKEHWALVRGDQQAPTRPHEFQTRLLMGPAFEKQEVKSTGRSHCSQSKPECGRGLQGNQRGDNGEVTMTFMNLHQGQRHACLSKVYLASWPTGRASAVTENGGDAKSIPKAVLLVAPF